MSQPRAPASAARFVAGLLAALWGMVGLTQAYAFASLYGATAAIVAAVALNVILVSSAALAFVNAPHWRGLMLLGAALVTLDRLFNMVFLGVNAGAVILYIAALLAIGAVVALSPSSRRRKV